MDTLDYFFFDAPVPAALLNPKAKTAASSTTVSKPSSSAASSTTSTSK